MTGRPFEREVRNVVAGGVLFLIFLAGVSLVVLRNTADWGVRQTLAQFQDRTRLVAEGLGNSTDPAGALAGDERIAQALREAGARAAALYDPAGGRLASASFLPDASLSPARLTAEEHPSLSAEGLARDLSAGSPSFLVAVVPVGGRALLRICYDGVAVAEARRNVRILSVVVPAGAAVLVLLVVPFLRHLMRPIDALTETARDAGAVVPPAGTEAGPGGRDEAETAVATFARTVEELRKRTAELEEMRRREQERADSLALTAESLVKSTNRLEHELSSRRELAALGEMSAGIAHEFRNATGTILGWVRLAATTEDAEARARHLQAIRDEAEHVARVTGDFLFFARPERLEMATVSLGPLVEEIVGEQRALTPDVSLATGGSFASAPVDPALFRRAIVNLLKNACEAARGQGRGGRVLVRGEGIAQGSAVLAVEDDGPGVPPEVLPKLFVPFFSTKESGTGLGLALVAKIAALHGGAVAVERSRELGGARFVLALPAAG